MGNIIVPDDDSIRRATVALACEKKLKYDEDGESLKQIQEEIKGYFEVKNGRGKVTSYLMGSEHKIVSLNGSAYLCSGGSTAQWVVPDNSPERLEMTARHTAEKLASGLCELVERESYIRYDWKTRLREQSSATV